MTDALLIARRILDSAEPLMLDVGEGIAERYPRPIITTNTETP